MKKKLKIFFIIILVLFGSGSLTYQFFPGIITDGYQSWEYKKNGFSVKQIEVDGDIFEYVEGGKGPSVILLHGFQGDKRSVFGYAKDLVKDYHIIVLDSSGHGGSSHHKGQKYDLASLAVDFSRFVDAMRLDHFHLVGTSMGGGISLHYSILHPEKVLSIEALNPLGVNPPIKSDFQICLDNGKNPFFPNNLSELDEFGRMLIGKPFPWKNRIKEYVLEKMLLKRDFYKKAFGELVTSIPIDGDLCKINTPVLILGGKKDRVLHYSSYELFHDKLPHSKIILLEDGTHVFVGNSYKRALEELKDFIKKN